MENPKDDGIWFETQPIVDDFVNVANIPVLVVRRVVLETRDAEPLEWACTMAMLWLN